MSKGSFSVLLGSANPLSLTFDSPYWLGVSVNGGAELTPRIALSSSPYALSLKVPFQAASNDSTPTLWAINPSGYDALRVSSSFKIYPDGANPAFQQLYDPTGNPSLQLLAGGNTYDTSLLITNPSTGAIPAYIGTASGHPGTNFGNLTVGGLNNSRFLRVDGYNGGTGDPKLSIQSGVSNIVFDSHQAGDGAVQLPQASIGPNEMFGLPGLGQSYESALITLNTTQMTDVETTTVYVPTSGFVVLDATGQVRLDDVAGNTNLAECQVDDSPSTAADGTQIVIGSVSRAVTTTNYHMAHCTRSYFKTPGLYTFHFKAMRAPVGAGFAYVFNATLRATFFPTAYGPVQTSVLASDLSPFERAMPLTAVNDGVSPAGPQAWSVDLRELQLKAALAATEAERAKNALLEAEAAQAHAELLRGNTPPAARARSAAVPR